MAQSLQAGLSVAGFHVDLVPATRQAFFGNYLENPSAAKRDLWDLAPPVWGPDWPGNNARTTLEPLFTDPGAGYSDFGGYSSLVTDSIINRALVSPEQRRCRRPMVAGRAPSARRRGRRPHGLREPAMYHSSAVHGCNYWWGDGNCDPTNVWLSR